MASLVPTMARRQVSVTKTTDYVGVMHLRNAQAGRAFKFWYQGAGTTFRIVARSVPMEGVDSYVLAGPTVVPLNDWEPRIVELPDGVFPAPQIVVEVKRTTAGTTNLAVQAAWLPIPEAGAVSEAS